MKILASELGGCGDSNEDSLVLQLVAYKTKFKALFVGDLEGSAVDKLLKDKSKIIKSDILRLAHHGSRNNNANSDKFLKAVNPTIAFSSSDPGHKSFCHPYCSIKKWFIKKYIEKCKEKEIDYTTKHMKMEKGKQKLKEKIEKDVKKDIEENKLYPLYLY